eukprot:TRINITY_DN9556_c0_g1_i1.p1 TRINITY_DN9556_c0_g1~~TRINITY_DN9556_c0_g1_i1.p1  ORF type:complete len:324 (+),score=86.30 TRINITY_DN9556_c0_g1_i1:53-1024(+)
MDNMLPSPALEDIELGTPHHALEEDQMIAPSAQDQQQKGAGNVYSFGFTPQNMLSSGHTPQNMLSSGHTPQNMLNSGHIPNTPQNLLASTPHNLLSSSGATPRGLDQGGLMGAGGQQPSHHYAPVALPAPPSPAMPIPTPGANDIVPQLQNIVSTVNMGCTLDLKKIALSARNAEYNPRRFAAVIMRIRDPRTTALIFRSGKMVCTGAKSEEESRLAARKYARIIQKLGFQTKFKDFKIQNMVGSSDVKFPIRLEGLVLTHSQFASYEPELFPGLIYRMVKPRIVLLIFVSGKVVLTGAKVREEIYEAFDNIFPILKNFKKQQ